MNPKEAGQPNALRYWSVWILTLSVLLLLFLKGVSLMLRSFNAWAGLGLALLLYLLMAVLLAKRNTTPQHYPLFRSVDLGFEYEEVSFPSRDGLNLSGWFVPGKNGATVILTHDFSRNRLSCTDVARILAQQGFGVLLYDLRGHGQSQAAVSTWGWVEINDLLGALDYLRKRPGVDRDRIGALGFGLGAQITLRLAAQEPGLRAVAAEAPTFAALSDHVVSSAFSLRKLVFYPWLWLSYQYQSLLTGVPQPVGVVQAMPRIAPRPLLIIAPGRGEQYLMASRLFEAAGEPKELYHIPEAVRVACCRARPEEYAKRVGEFFENLIKLSNS